MPDRKDTFSRSAEQQKKDHREMEEKVKDESDNLPEGYRNLKTFDPTVSSA